MISYIKFQTFRRIDKKVVVENNSIDSLLKYLLHQSLEDVLVKTVELLLHLLFDNIILYIFLIPPNNVHWLNYNQTNFLVRFYFSSLQN